MDVRNCRKCGRMFNYVSGAPICESCKEKLEEKFQEVKAYVQENKTAPIPMIAEECDVDVSQIRKWIREERLEFSEDSPVGLPCENCGATIRSGKFCEKCKLEVANRLGEALPKPKPVAAPKKPDKQPPKMRYLDK